MYTLNHSDHKRILALLSPPRAAWLALSVALFPIACGDDEADEQPVEREQWPAAELPPLSSVEELCGPPLADEVVVAMGIVAHDLEGQSRYVPLPPDADTTVERGVVWTDDAGSEQYTALVAEGEGCWRARGVQADQFWVLDHEAAHGNEPEHLNFSLMPRRVIDRRYDHYLDPDAAYTRAQRTFEFRLNGRGPVKSHDDNRGVQLGCPGTGVLGHTTFAGRFDLTPVSEGGTGYATYKLNHSGGARLAIDGQLGDDCIVSAWTSEGQSTGVWSSWAHAATPEMSIDIGEHERQQVAVDPQAIPISTVRVHWNLAHHLKLLQTYDATVEWTSYGGDIGLQVPVRNNHARFGLAGMWRFTQDYFEPLSVRPDFALFRYARTASFGEPYLHARLYAGHLGSSSIRPRPNRVALHAKPVRLTGGDIEVRATIGPILGLSIAGQSVTEDKVIVVGERPRFDILPPAIGEAAGYRVSITRSWPGERFDLRVDIYTEQPSFVLPGGISRSGAEYSLLVEAHECFESGRRAIHPCAWSTVYSLDVEFIAAEHEARDHEISR